MNSVHPPSLYGSLVVAVTLGALACSAVQQSGAPPPPTSKPDPTQAASDPSTAAAPAPQASSGAVAHEDPSPPLHRVSRSKIRVGSEEYSLHLPQDVSPPLSSVLVLHSARGRTESVLNWCDRLAQAGFAAIAFDFFDGSVAQSQEEARRLRDAANGKGQELQGAIQRAYDGMRSDPRVAAKDRFLLGWSYGAAWATYSTGVLSDITGVVAYYGQAFTDNPQLFDTLNTPVLFIGGELDSTPPPERLRKIAAQLDDKGKDASLELFPAGHGFAEASHPGYDRDVAERAWSAAMAFLQEHATPRTDAPPKADGTPDPT